MTQEKRTIEPADLFRLKFITSAQLAPDGKQIAYAVTHVNDEKETEYSAIWLMTLANGETRQLTSGTARDGAPAWSPDGKQIAFLSTRAEKQQIYVISTEGGEARAVTSLKQGVGGAPVWSPDGTQLAFTAVPIEEARDPSKPYRVTRFVYRFNDLEYLDDVVQSIYVIGVGGGEPRRLTSDSYMNANPQWSPDGRELMYAASMLPELARAYTVRLRAVNVESGSIRDLIDGWSVINTASWSADGKQVVFTGQPNGLPIGSKSDLWVVPASGGTPECRTAGLKVGVDGGLQADMPVSMLSAKVPLSADGKFAYLRVQDGGTVHIYRAALTGSESWQPLVTGDRACFLQGKDNQRLVYLVSDINQPLDLYSSDLDGKNERQLTCLNDEWLAQVKMPSIEHLLFPGSDGAQVEGWLMTPPEGSAPYPTILDIHGGPHSAYGRVFHFDTQLLCGAGYAVLMVNHRASTGYGNEFSTAIKGDWGNLDYKDLMAGVDYVIDKGWADGDRLGVCGLSGGGNLSCWTVGQTRRFKAAVPENPVTNWVSFYGVSDIGVWFGVEELGGHPHEIPDIYARCSPITYAHTCTTPTLLVQGEHDWRCPPEQSEQFYTVLKANGCIVEMLRLPNSPHGGTIYGPPTLRKAHNDALLGWMNRYVLGKTD